jgi:hypothetical protein
MMMLAERGSADIYLVLCKDVKKHSGDAIDQAGTKKELLQAIL